MNSPGQILKEHIVTRSFPIFTRVSANKDWPLYVGHLPEDDGKGVKTEAAAIYDTTGVRDGRNMCDGITIFHEGLQIKNRSDSYVSAFAKMKAIQNFIEQITNENVTIGANTFTIISIMQTTNITPLGRDDARRRTEFVINLLITLK